MELVADLGGDLLLARTVSVFVSDPWVKSAEDGLRARDASSGARVRVL
jgi:hypothetical protein